jgi:predicted  nucleic acid-binding Zn-ribbon protein
MWITAEMMTDLYNHDAYSRGVAREAIQKYNDHIERCNRAIEAADHGMSIPGADSDANNIKSVLDSVTDERDSYKRERDLAKRDLLEKEKLIADMSVRLDAVAKKTDPNRAAAVSIDMSAADPKVVQLINNLQEQLYAERRENRRLKGA